MFEVVGAIAGTATYAVLVGVLVGFSPARRSAKLAAFTGAAVWGVIIVTIAALGISAPRAAGAVPIPVVASAVLLILLFGGWGAFPQFRSALLSVPLPALIGVNAARLGGVFFLILTADGRLSAPFGPAAGWGDMLVGALAIPIAAVAAIGAAKKRGWVGAWNALGAIDLIDAVTLGALSSPGTPFRVFTEGPGTTAMTALPWIMVPTMLVPLYFLIHLTVGAKLRSAARVPRPVPLARSTA